MYRVVERQRVVMGVGLIVHSGTGRVSGVQLHPSTQELGDKGYQGWKKLHATSHVPTKKPKGGQLSTQEKCSTRELAQRILRLATGESTKRSQVDAEHLREQLREGAVEQVAQAPEDERWLIADGSDLRKPYAQEMPALMQVRD